jgi:hypothetical protein
MSTADAGQQPVQRLNAVASFPAAVPIRPAIGLSQDGAGRGQRQQSQKNQEKRGKNTAAHGAFVRPDT